MKTGSTNKKIREIVNMIKDGSLLPRPEFQRRLVWSQADKNLFLDSVLRGYPFPEIYLADGDVDLETARGTQLLMDGLQRISTLVQYFDGDDGLKLLSVPPYRSLKENEQTAFLQYEIAVRDLGKVDKPDIIEVFKRLNATKYSLLDIEVNNAVYAGALKKFAEEIAKSSIFEVHRVFNSLDYKRMGDLRFSLSLIATLLVGYFNRDDAFEEVLSRFNDEFPYEADIKARLERVFEFLDECGFEDDSRVWKKADLFTIIVELDSLLSAGALIVQPALVVHRLSAFFNEIDKGISSEAPLAFIYYKSALQASNDRGNRIRRGMILSGIILGAEEREILRELTEIRAIGPQSFQPNFEF